MKKTSLFLPLLLLVCCASLLPAPVSAQPFESTFGSLANHEEPQDGKPIPNSRYIVLSNTQSFGPASRIMLTILNPNGTINTCMTIHDPASPTTAYFGTSIDLDLNAAGAHTGYFIAGSRLIGNNRQAILIRTNTFGVVIWVKVLPNQDNTGTLIETGVSAERQSNGDVIVTATGRNTAGSTYRFTVSRFNLAGAQIWSNRYYGSSTAQTFEATEACNALRSGVAVIVVTGRFWVAGSANSHTFLSCINAATGVEVWRRSYDSGAARDAGIDVVYKPAVANEPEALVAVGYAGQVGTTLWVIRANPLNGLASSKTYVPNVFTSAFSGDAVNLDLAGSRVAITGSMAIQPGGVLLSGTYAMVLNLFGAELPAWTFYYSSSSPITPAPRSITRVPAGPAGYFVTCGTRLTGSAFNDSHAIRTDALGGVGANGCSRTALTILRTPMGTSAARAFTRTPFTWTNIQLTRTTVPVVQEFCIGPSLVGSDDRDAEPASAELSEPRLYPNPVTSGSSVTLEFELPEPASVDLRVFDLTGRQVWMTSQALEAGTQRLDLPSGQWNNGIYLVNLQSGSFKKTMRLVVTSGE